MPITCAGLKIESVSDALELELEIAVHVHAGAENQPRVLCKSSKCFSSNSHHLKIMALSPFVRWKLSFGEFNSAQVLVGDGAKIKTGNISPGLSYYKQMRSEQL